MSNFSQNILCIIPARMGSTRLKHKNLQNINNNLSLIDQAIEESPGESLLYYRLVIYLMDAGRYKESINVLESALSLNFDNHDVLFDFVPNFESQSALIRVINQFKNSGNR